MSLDALVEQDASLIKRGETIIITTFHRPRTLEGLLLYVKAVPPIEDFFRSAGSGELVDVRTWGRYWKAYKSEDPLEVYDLSMPALHGSQGAGRIMYRFDQPAYPLLAEGLRGDVNLSFLRLKGISEAGVNVVVHGVYSRTYVEDLSEKISEACRHFYSNYLKPVDVAVVVSIQDNTK